MIGATRLHWSGLVGRVRKTSLRLIFHCLFLGLIASEIMLAWLLFSSSDRYYASVSGSLENKIDAVERLLTDRETLALLESPSALKSPAPLTLARLDDVVPVANVPTRDWVGAPRCQKTFTVDGLAPMTVCAGVLAPDERWNLRDGDPASRTYGRPGKYLYLTVRFAASPPVAPASGQDKQQQIETWAVADRIEIQLLEAGAVRDHMVILHEALPGTGALSATVYRRPRPSGRLQLLRNDSGDPRTVGTMCALRLPEGTRDRLYLCRFAAKSFSAFGNAQAWPPVDGAVGLRVSAAIVKAPGERAVPLAATFRQTPRGPVDESGVALLPLAKDLERIVPASDGDNVTLRGPGNSILWQQGAGDDPTLAAAKGVTKRTRALSGKPGYSIDYFSDPRAVQEKWYTLSSGKALLIFTAALISVTALAYFLIFQLIIKRILDLSRAVEAVNPQSASSVVMRKSLFQDEIVGLGDAFDTLLGQARNAAQSELDLLKSIGHEIKSPLQTLLVITQKDENPDPEKHEADRRDAADAARRMDRAVKIFSLAQNPADALNAAKFTLERCDLVAFVTTFVERIREHEPSRPPIDLATDIPHAFVKIEGDPLAIAIDHILVNAARHGAPGEPIRMHLAADADFAAIEIINAGDPIPPENIGRVFDAGFTTTAKGSGNLGQGLWVAKRSVNAMLGTIVVENQDRAVCFRMTFPLRP